MAKIHPSAVIDPRVELGDDVVVGPGCVLTGPVRIGAGTELKGLVWIEGKVTIGRGNRVFPHVAIGCGPQDWRSDPADATEVVIGDDNVIRENVTIHRGTRAGGGITRVGSNCMLMVGSHLGHDAAVEDRVTLINLTTVGGHCRVETGAWLSGYSAVHQFTTVGRYAFFAGFAGSDRDVPPYSRIEGDHPVLCKGVNVVGLRRLGLSVEVIRQLREALDSFYPRQELDSIDRQALSAYDGREDLNEHVRYLVGFVKRSAAHRFGRAREAGRFAAGRAAQH